jgi:hypothetical protein
VAQTGRVFFATTDKDVDFTGALAQNASATATLSVPQLPSSCQARLNNIQIISDQQLAWEVWLWGTSDFAANSSNLDAVFPFGRWAFTAADGVQIAGAGPYYYFISGLGLPYQELAGLSKLNVMLVNRSATSKNAGVTGEIVIKFALEPAVGW